MYRPDLTVTSRMVASEICDGGVKMRLVLNGEEGSFAVSDVAELVASLGLDVRKVAVERNLEIIPRSVFARTPLMDGDRIEIVHFIGGG